MALANREALRLNHEYIGTEHILLGLLKEGGGAGVRALHAAGVDQRKLVEAIEKLVKRGDTPVEEDRLPQTPRAKKSIEYAIEEACNLHQNFVGTEHMMLGLLRDYEGVAGQVIGNFNVTPESLRPIVVRLQSEGVTD